MIFTVLHVSKCHIGTVKTKNKKPMALINEWMNEEVSGGIVVDHLL